MKNSLAKIIPFFIILLAFFIPFKALKAEERVSIILDKPTIERGYTLKSLDRNLTLGLLPNFTTENSKDVKVVINDLGREASIPDNKNLISNLYEFEIDSKNFNKPKAG